MKKNKLDLNKIKTISLKDRRSKVEIADFARCCKKEESFGKFIKSLPNLLAAADFKQTLSAVLKARKQKKMILLMMGAHVIKCGLGPLINDLMRKGFIGAVALNGAGAIHDFEIAFCGKTSEEVETNIKDGSFGMSRETAEFLNKALEKAAQENKGFGEVLGRAILQKKLPFSDLSIVANAVKLNIPLTIHVAIGTDIIHPHPECKGEFLGKAAMIDFHRFIEVVAQLNEGVVLNVGSAVIMPEVFLKAVSTVRNLGFKLNAFTSVCFDMIKHYRPMQNVVKRPAAGTGNGYYIIGHHEIMLPLLHRALIESE